MRTILPFIVCFVSLLTGCSAPSIPLETPISLAPRGTIEQKIQIQKKVNYVVNIVFARDGVSFEKIKELVGAAGICKIGEFCSKGVVVPVSWSLQSTENGKIVASGKVDSFESSGWSATDVHRWVGGFNVDKGNYLFKMEVLRDVPELAILQTRVIIYNPYK